ncbi:hypothetical protein [Limimaricola sp.]|uniref:hypothetical protein n=1 Tax=Limimaricola sp. TaxID=2211665 RepID=UPI00405882D3
MARRLIAATLSLTLGLSGLAPAPVLAQERENMGRLIGGLVALGVIGAAAHKEREKDRKKEEKRAEKAEKEARKEAKKAAKEARKEREKRREEAKERLVEQLERLTEAEEDRRDGDARTRAALGALGAIIAGEGAAGGIEAITRELGLDAGNTQAEAEAQAQAETEARRAEIVRQAEEARLAELAREAEARRRAEARARLDARTAPPAAEALPPVPREEVTADLLRDWEPAPAPRQPETTTPVATGEIPFACLRRQQAGFEAASVVDGDCLDDYPVLARSFPLDCAVTGQSEGRITSGYDTQCLRDRGYRVAVR